MDSGRADVELDLFSQCAVQSPHAVHARLRERSPVHPVGPGRWVVTRHDDARALLVDPRCAHWGQEPVASASSSPTADALAAALRLFAPADGPGAPRRILGAALGPALLADMEGHLEREADRLLGTWADGRSFDALADYAHPLAMIPVGRLLGLSDPQASALGTAMTQWTGPFFDCLRGPGVPPVPAGPAAHLQARFDQVIAEAADRPDASLVAQLRTVLEEQDESAGLHDRLLNAVLVLVYATHHNMLNAMGNALLALATQPEAQARLRAEPALAERAFLELLRHDSPLQYIVLVARDDFVLRGCAIARGEEILVAVGSANRDPDVFSQPAFLDFDRPNPHALLSFGAGPWRCMGARLALRIGTIAVGKFVARGFHLPPDIPPLRWTRVPMAQRGLVCLPLVLGPA